MKKIRIVQTLVLITLAVLFAPNLFSGEPGTLLLRKSFPETTGSRVRIDAYTGNVNINGWNKNVIEVRIYGSPDAVRNLNFNINTDDRGIIINASKRTAGDDASQLGLRYEINVPSDFSVRVNGSKKVTINRHSLPVDVTE